MLFRSTDAAASSYAVQLRAAGFPDSYISALSALHTAYPQWQFQAVKTGWRAEHPEFEKIVFHGLRHSSATYQLLQSGGDFKSVQGSTGHATATVLMDTYAHTQDKPRLELTEKIEADFYSQDVAGAKPQEPPENKTPVATKITGKMILEAIRQMDAEERRELTRVLFA